MYYIHIVLCTLQCVCVTCLERSSYTNIRVVCAASAHATNHNLCCTGMYVQYTHSQKPSRAPRTRITHTHTPAHNCSAHKE